MNIQGVFCTLSSNDGIYECHLGSYDNGVDIILNARLWNKNVPLHHLIYFLGVLQRDDKGKLFIDVKDFGVLGAYQEGVTLTTAIHAHGVVEKGHTLNSKSWYCKIKK